MDPEEVLDVIVIGAGISGLVAAKRLQQSSLQVKVLESSDRVGGRTLTHFHKQDGDDGDPDTFDLGAHWVSQSQPRIMKLMEELGIGFYQQNIKGRKVLQVGDDKVRTYKSDIPNLNSYAALLKMNSLINKFESLAKEVDMRDPYAHPQAHQLDSTSVEGFVQAHTGHESVMHIINAAMQACVGCDCSQVSPLFFLAYANAGGGVMKLLLADEGSAQEFRVKGGTQEVSKGLSEKIGQDNVLLKKTVTAITEENEEVSVCCADGSSYRAKYVISAIPFAKLTKVTFDPPLSQAKRSLLNSMPMGNLMKVYVMYEKAFWLNAGYSGEVVATGGPTKTPHCESGPVTVFYDATTCNGTPALVGFLAGKNADQWFSRKKEERKAAVLVQLEAYFGKEAKKPKDYIEKNWTDDANLNGGPVCHVVPGGMHNFHALRQPHGRVHFAGTEMATRWTGYMDGAVQAGHWAAASIIKSIESDKLTDEDKDVFKEFKTSKRDYGKLQRTKHSGSMCSIV